MGKHCFDEHVLKILFSIDETVLVFLVSSCCFRQVCWVWIVLEGSVKLGAMIWRETSWVLRVWWSWQQWCIYICDWHWIF